MSTIIPSADVLVQQCLNGEASAYRALYDRYSKAMYNTALRILNRTDDAEDILQEAFTDAFQQLKSFEGRSTFGAWLRQIVVYKSIAHLKKQKLHFNGLETDAENIADETVLEEDEVWYTVDSIKQAMQKLPDGYRTVLTLHLIEGFEQEEVAEMMKVAHSTVRTQYMRAKQKLLQVLKQEVYEQ
ncbi:RNA polymerase sigma factor [Lacibacter sediminis]|uniref:RNA polymerase sigma factor n=1 Tax=Lacibacter sediminis TaxID=2760713 RepID=A0A7G5XMW3_9BACT|nr:RNA polymerase sigma factor [Lacibacter sediminis]